MSKRRNKNKKAGPVTIFRPEQPAAPNAPEMDAGAEAEASQVPDMQASAEPEADGASDRDMDSLHDMHFTLDEPAAEDPAAEEPAAEQEPAAAESATAQEPLAEMNLSWSNADTETSEAPVGRVDEVEDASGALARAIDVDPDTITSNAAYVESIPIVEAQDTMLEMGEQQMEANADDAHAGTAWGSVGASASGTAVTFDIPDSDAAAPDVVAQSGDKGRKSDRKLKLNKLQKHARSAPAPEPEAAPPESAPPAVPRPPREPRTAAFAKLAEYQSLSLAHVPGLPEETDVPGHWRGVGFGLGGRRLVSAFDEVVEIMRLPQITHVPGTQPWMLGVANVRGTLLPVVDLKQFLEGERTVMHESQRVLVVRQAGGNVAVLIDQLYGQRSFNDSQKMATTAVDSESRYGYFIKQVYRVGDNDWGVFSMSMLTRTPEFRQAAA